MRLELAIVALEFISGDLYFQCLENRAARIESNPQGIRAPDSALAVAMLLDVVESGRFRPN